MQKNKVEISIIIVHYKVKQVLFDCLRSIEQNKPKISFEIIVVDNDEEKTIGKDIKRKFPNVQYLENPVNNGWGGGTNLGASVAVGKYLFFLNPDTVVLPHAINQLYRFIKKNKECAVASALLLDENKKAYPLQGTEDLSPLKGIIVYSFLNKLFPQNLISNRFWLKWWNKKRIQEIDIVPLSASIVKKEVFDKADGFDENLFLYFEEYDFGRRVNSLGYKNYIIPQAQVIHFWELSAKHRSDIGSIIAKSRFYYFRKY